MDCFPPMKYPLLPYSQLVFDMLQANPDVYTTRFSLRVDKREVDVPQLQQAIETALRNHPVFSMLIDNEGMQYFEKKSDIFHGPYHSVDFKDEGNSVRIDIAYNRILGDTKSELILFEDVCRAYQNMPISSDYYLNFLEHIEQEKLSLKYRTDCQWLETNYGNTTCPVHPQTDIPLVDIDNAVEGIWTDDYTDLRSAINNLMENTLVPLTAIFSLSSALAIMEYNDADEAALTWAYDGRETENEQRIYGSLHRDIPFKISRNSKDELLRETRKQYREGIAHSNYPLTLTKPHSDVWNFALNVLVRPTANDMYETIPFSFKVIPPCNEYNPAYALLDVEIVGGEQLVLTYRYSATHYKEESIKNFAALVRKYVEWLIE